MTRPYSVALKRKMLERLTGKDAAGASRLAKQIGVRQLNLSRWLREARNLPAVEADKSYEARIRCSGQRVGECVKTIRSGIPTISSSELL